MFKCAVLSPASFPVFLLQIFRIHMRYFLHANCCTVELRVVKDHLTFGEIQLSMRCYIPRFHIPSAFSYQKDVFPHSSQHNTPKSMVTYLFHDVAYIIFLS